MAFTVWYDRRSGWETCTRGNKRYADPDPNPDLEWDQHYGPSISAGLARTGQSHSDGEQSLLFVC